MTLVATVGPQLDLSASNEVLARLSALDRLQWAAETFGDQLVVLASMQKTSSVVLHLCAELGLSTEILFVDTGFHFHETLRLRDEFMRRYKLNIVTVYPEHTPEEQEVKFGRKLHLFVDGQPECCRMRKEEPFLSYMMAHGKKAVVNGVRRAEGGRRRNLPYIVADARTQGSVVHPIVDWSDLDLEEFLTRTEAPVHPLHAQSYPSVGCQCCTTPVGPHEAERAGRWRHLRTGDDQPAYCGINFTDGSGI